jgi:hypothetical protein
MRVFKVRGRVAVALLLAGVWFEACGGESFQATGSGGAGHAGEASHAGDAGSAQGGDGQGAEAGATSGGDAGAPGAGMSSGGTESGGGPNGGAPNGGEPNGGAPNGGDAQAGSAGSVAHGGSGGALGATNSGDCKSDADCPNAKCIELSPGGFRTCQVVVPLAAKCGLGDACCTDDPTKACTAGRCVAGPPAPSCGLAQAVRNFCQVAACTTSAACKDNGTCAPAGTLDRKEAVCLPGSCRLDKECNAVKGGKCEPVTMPCCGGVSGLYCVYPVVGCRSTADCKAGQTCELGSDAKSMECKAGGVNCPG